MIFKLATFDFQRVNPTNIPLKILWIHYKMSMFSQARVGQVNLISMQGWSKMRVWTLGKLSDWDPWRHFGPALHGCPCCFYRSIGKLHTLRFRMATLPAGTRHLRWDVFFCRQKWCWESQNDQRFQIIPAMVPLHISKSSPSKWMMGSNWA